ncbi:MAG: MFS transporter [Variovorax sp.]|nr:MAG: MFS transporter [Variovorax sp.]
MKPGPGARAGADGRAGRAGRDGRDAPDALDDLHGPSDRAVARALPTLTAVQAVVAMGSFALSVLAPQLGVDLGRLGGLGGLLFGVGALASLASGRLIRWLGDLRLAALCTGCVLLAMAGLAAEAMATGGVGAMLWPAALLLGLAFGPETPASASVLMRVTPPARRPWVFSIRQTGNQIGAMAGSLGLPALLPLHAAAPFALVALLAAAVALACLRLARGAGPGTRPVAAPGPTAAADVDAAADAATTTPPGPATAATRSGDHASGLRELAASPALRLLTLTMVVFMANQVCLNLFVMSHAVRHWRLDVPAAAGWVALMQGAGLAGRLLWGRVAQRPGVSTRRLLGGLGLLTGGSGLLLFLWPATPPAAALALLIALLGLSASGWNGVMVAELARLAGPARAGAVTGAALLFGYAGLALAPPGFAVLGGALGTATAFALPLAATAALGARLLWAADRRTA